MTSTTYPSPGDFVAGCRAVLKPGQYTIVPRENRCWSSLDNLKDVNLQVMVTPHVGANFVMSELAIQKDGGTEQPVDDGLEHFFYVLEGKLTIEIDGSDHMLTDGMYAWLPPGSPFHFQGTGEKTTRSLWFRRRYSPLSGYDVPQALFGNERNVPAVPEVDLNPEQQLIPYEQMAFDVAFNIVVCQPGAHYGLVESHAWQHGMYMLAGEGAVWLNGCYHEVRTGDFVWIAPYCPEFFVAVGWQNTPIRCLLYWDGNRDYAVDL